MLEIINLLWNRKHSSFGYIIFVESLAFKVSESRQAYKVQTKWINVDQMWFCKTIPTLIINWLLKCEILEIFKWDLPNQQNLHPDVFGYQSAVHLPKLKQSRLLTLRFSYMHLI